MANWIILFLLSVAHVVLCVYSGMEFQRRVTNKTKAVYLPKYMFWLGAVSGAAFLMTAWLAAAQDGSLGLTIIFGIFALIGMLLMLGWKNCYIVYDKAGFTQRNLIGMQRCFTYDQVTAWHPNISNPVESSLYAAEKKISFNLMSENGPDFLVTLSAGYRKTHGNKQLPEMRTLRKGNGGFCAHVHNPGEFLAIFIMLAAFIVGPCIWLVIDGMQPIDENDGQKYHLTFSSWEINEHSVILTSPQRQEPFIIGGYEDYLSGFGRLKEKCDGSTLFSVWAERFDPDDEEPFYRVYAISSEEEVYRSFEDSTAYKRQDIPFIVGIFGVFLLILLAFSAFIYAVGSNPQKFPRWVVYCCFKKDAIDIE